MYDHLQEPAGNGRRTQVSAWIATLIAVFLLITAPLVLRHRVARATGNTWPPAAPVWQGSGILHAADASVYPLYVKLRFERKHEGSGPADGKTNLIGTAQLCTAQKTPLDLDVSGSLNAWWLENGKAVTLYFRTERNSAPKLFFLLYGSWQGTELVLEDRGSLTYFFNTSDAKSPRGPATTPKSTEITLHYGEKDQFEALCPSPT